MDCTLFGARADGLSKILTKGTKVAIDGKLRWSQWERDGQKRSKVEIIVDSLDFMSQRNSANYAAEPVATPAVAPVMPSEPASQEVAAPVSVTETIGAGTPEAAPIPAAPVPEAGISESTEPYGDDIPF